MEETLLTSQEIIHFLIEKINNDEEFHKEFPTFVGQLACNAVLLNVSPEQSKEQQLEIVYIIFKSILNMANVSKFMQYNRPPKINLKDYLPLRDLYKRCESLTDKCFDDLDNSNYIDIWIYKRLYEAIFSTINRVQNGYKNANTQNDVKKQIENFISIPKDSNDKKNFYNEAEIFFKTQINPSRDLFTKQYIEQIRYSIDNKAKISSDKAKITYNNDFLLQEREDAYVRIVEKCSFRKEWIKLNMPKISQTDILCQWESENDYKVLIEELLYIDYIEKYYFQLICPNFNEKVLESAKAKQTKEQARLSLVLNEINNWLIESLTPYISEDDIKIVISAVDNLCARRKDPKIIGVVKNVEKLKPYDINAVFWVVWQQLYKKTDLNIERQEVAELAKKLFSQVYKDVSSSSIVSHFKDNGAIIKIPAKYANQSISKRTKSK